MVPDVGSWMHLKRLALPFILTNEARLGAAIANDLVRRVNSGGPEAARALAAVDTLVPSRDLPQRHDEVLVPFGRAFFLEIGGDWHGSLSLRDQETMHLVASYLDAHGSGR